MARSADHERSVDGVGVHAGLVVVMHRDQRPVCDYTGDADILNTVCAGAGDQVLDSGGVEEFNVGEGENLGEEGGCEQGGVLDDDVVGVARVFFVGDAEVAEEDVCGFAHDHGREKLATEPGAATLNSVRMK